MSKNFKRLILGVSSLLLAGVIALVIAPQFTKPENVISVVVVATDIPKGTKITDDVLRVMDITEDYLHENIILEKEEIIGMYAKQDLFKSDLINKNSISLDYSDSENAFINKNTDDETFYFTSTIQSLAAGGANKLLPEDIVSVSIMDEETNVANLLDELRYVRVVDVVNEYGQSVKSNPSNDELKENMASAIVLEVNQSQLELLTQYEYSGSLHVSFYYRGTEERCNELLAIQKNYWESE